MTMLVGATKKYLIKGQIYSEHHWLVAIIQTRFVVRKFKQIERGQSIGGTIRLRRKSPTFRCNNSTIVVCVKKQQKACTQNNTNNSTKSLMDFYICGNYLRSAEAFCTSYAKILKHFFSVSKA